MDKDIAVKEPTNIIETTEVTETSIIVQDEYVNMDYTDRPKESEIERRTKYSTLLRPKFKEVVQWIAEGNNDYSIAEKIGVHYNTLSRWKRDYAEFSELYMRAQDARNCLTMNSGFKRANGIKVMLNKQKVLSDGSVKNYKEEQYFPPDVNAMDLYLRNNDPTYKSAKADTGGLTLVQNNYSIPELKQSIQKLLQEYKEIDAIDVTPDE